MAYERINWQNLPSEATAINNINLNKMDNAIYELDGKATTTDTAIANLQSGKVDKVNGKGLSQVDDVTVTQHVAYGTVVSTIKTYKQDGTEVTSQVCNGIVVDSALSNSSTNPVQNKVVKSAIDEKSTVAISDTLETGTTLANITIDGTTTAIKGSDIEVDEELSPTSTNPVENKAIYDALNNLLPSKTVSGNPISISDASGFDAKALTVTMNPIQDLHGYSNPWVGGAGKQLVNITDRDVTVSGVNIKVKDGVITINGTSTAAINYHLVDNMNFAEKSYTFSLSGNLSGDDGMIAVQTSVGNKIASNAGNTFTASMTGFMWFFCAAGKTFNNIVVKPMICLSTASEPTVFAPYENICPISGRTEASVKRTGVNQWDGVWEGGDLNVGVDGANHANANRIRSKNYVRVTPNTTYYFKTQSYVNFTVAFYAKDKSYPYNAPNVGYKGVSNNTLTIPEWCYYIRFYFNATSATYNEDVCLNYPSTDTEYHAYTAETHTSTFGQTVYGGKLDMVSGKLVVDRAYKTVGSITNWGYTSGKFYSIDTLGMLKTTGKTIISDTYKTIDNIPGSGVTMDDFSVCCISTAAGLDRIYITDSRYSDEATFKTAMSAVQLCFLLATPTEITLTPQEIELLKGQNVLWTDGDNIKLVYSADIKAWVLAQLSS